MGPRLVESSDSMGLSGGSALASLPAVCFRGARMRRSGGLVSILRADWLRCWASLRLLMGLGLPIFAAGTALHGDRWVVCFARCQEGSPLVMVLLRWTHRTNLFWPA
ncbi:hypothetical protein BHS06_02480 [Myxococcus xanthus]|nr:hypothetical protein BHS06_02480 [Myxococcus xanthus]